MHFTQNTIPDEASYQARLMFLPQVQIVQELLPGHVCVVACVDEVQEHWMRLGQRAQHGSKAREAVVALDGVRVLARSQVEWEMLAMLGVRRLAHEIEWWPARAISSGELRAQFVMRSELAQQLGLRIMFEEQSCAK